MREVRNVLVHNAGVIDRRLAERCPWCSWKVGKKVVVKFDEYVRYRRALTGYVMTVANRARVSMGLEVLAPIRK
jgi:hypothetical protein